MLDSFLKRNCGDLSREFFHYLERDFIIFLNVPEFQVWGAFQRTVKLSPMNYVDVEDPAHMAFMGLYDGP